MQDLYGNRVSTESPEAVAALNTFTEQFLGYGQGAGAILKAVEADESWSLGHAYCAALWMFLESPAARPKAQAAAALARETIKGADHRERAAVEAMLAWIDGDMDRSILLHHEAAEKNPRDLALLKIGQYHCFNRGDGEGIKRLAELALPAAGDVGFLHGMHAFGLEQCHRLEAAEAAGRKATEMNRNDPWAHHAVAHVMETQGRVDEGIAWMEGLSDSWVGCNSFMLTHNWWHTALFHLDRDEFDRVLALYDTAIWGVWKEYSQDQVNAVSLLARLELRGIDVGDRWEDLGAYLEPRTVDQINGFLDLHYLYGLARSGRSDAAASLLDNIAAKAATPGPDQGVWRDVVAPAGKGLLAHADEDWAVAADQLQAARAGLIRAGGSHAQRDFFELVRLNALEKSGQRSAAADEWARRLADRPGISHLHRKVAALRPE